MIELVTPAPVLDDEGVPVAEKTPRVDVFSVDGTTYSIDDKPSPSIGLRYLHLVRIAGLAVAQDWLLEETLGEEGHAELITFKTITAPQIQQVAAAVRSVVFGEVKPAGASGPKASGRTSSAKKPRATRTR